MKRFFGNSKQKEHSSSSLNDHAEIAERSSNSLDYKQKNKDKMKKYKDSNKTHNSSAHSLPMNLPYITNKVQLEQSKQTSKHTSEDESSSITSGSGLYQSQVHQTANSSNNAASIILNEDSSTSQFLKNKNINANSAHNSTNSQNVAVDYILNPTLLSNEPNINRLVFKEDLESILKEIELSQEKEKKLCEKFEKFKNQYDADLAIYNQNLQEEKERYDRLEEQMNDLIELHQNEVENLKQIIGDMEEKVQYQSEERLRDMNEILDDCSTRISRMEHQQYQQSQQLINFDSLDNFHASRFLLKLINGLLFILQVIYLLVYTIIAIINPFVKSRLRIFTTISFLSFFLIIFRQKEII